MGAFYSPNRKIKKNGEDFLRGEGGVLLTKGKIEKDEEEGRMPKPLSTIQKVSG